MRLMTSILFAITLGITTLFSPAVETVLNVDTTQPKALLAYQTWDQGATYDYRVMVKTGGARARLETNDVCVLQITADVTGPTWGIYMSSSVDTNSGSFLIPMVGLAGPLGDGSYQVYTYNTTTPSRKYSMGTGPFRLEETTGYGGIVGADLRRPLDTDVITQIGSNQFVRMSDIVGGIAEVDPNFTEWSLTNQFVTIELDPFFWEWVNTNTVSAQIAAMYTSHVDTVWATPTNWWTYGIGGTQTLHSVTYSIGWFVDVTTDFTLDYGATVVKPVGNYSGSSPSLTYPLPQEYSGTVGGLSLSINQQFNTLSFNNGYWLVQSLDFGGTDFNVIADPNSGGVGGTALLHYENNAVTNHTAYVLLSLSELQEVRAGAVSAQERIDWNMAYGYGAHNGLYRLVDWLPDWTDVQNKPAVVTSSAISAIWWGTKAQYEAINPKLSTTMYVYEQEP